MSLRDPALIGITQARVPALAQDSQRRIGVLERRPGGGGSGGGAVTGEVVSGTTPGVLASNTSGKPQWASAGFGVAAPATSGYVQATRLGLGVAPTRSLLVQDTTTTQAEFANPTSGAGVMLTATTSWQDAKLFLKDGSTNWFQFGKDSANGALRFTDLTPSISGLPQTGIVEFDHSGTWDANLMGTGRFATSTGSQNLASLPSNEFMVTAGLAANGWPTAGAFVVGTQRITYTGIGTGPDRFTGCSAGTGTIASGTKVVGVGSPQSVGTGIYTSRLGSFVGNISNATNGWRYNGTSPHANDDQPHLVLSNGSGSAQLSAIAAMFIPTAGQIISKGSILGYKTNPMVTSEGEAQSGTVAIYKPAPGDRWRVSYAPGNHGFSDDDVIDIRTLGTGVPAALEGAWRIDVINPVVFDLIDGPLGEDDSVGIADTAGTGPYTCLARRALYNEIGAYVGYVTNDRIGANTQGMELGCTVNLGKPGRIAGIGMVMHEENPYSAYDNTALFSTTGTHIVGAMRHTGSVGVRIVQAATGELGTGLLVQEGHSTHPIRRHVICADGVQSEFFTVEKGEYVSGSSGPRKGRVGIGPSAITNQTSNMNGLPALVVAPIAAPTTAVDGAQFGITTPGYAYRSAASVLTVGPSVSVTNQLGIGQAPTTYALSFVTSTAATGGIDFGADSGVGTRLYRALARVLRTDADFGIGQQAVPSTTTSGTGFFIGATGTLEQMRNTTGTFWRLYGNTADVVGTPTLRARVVAAGVIWEYSAPGGNALDTTLARVGAGQLLTSSTHLASTGFLGGLTTGTASTGLDTSTGLAMRRGDQTLTSSANIEINNARSFIRLTGGDATSTVSGVLQGNVDGRFLIIQNDSTHVVVIKDDAAALGTAANRIMTSTGADRTIADQGSMILAYDTNVSRWREVGGVGVT